MASKGTLESLHVPWQLSLGATGFDLRFSEGVDVKVSAFAAGIPACHEIERGIHLCDTKRVEIAFERPAYITLATAIGPHESIDLGRYDTSRLRFANGSTAERQFATDWENTGICPNAWAYKVAGSSLVDDLGLVEFGVCEYLLVGDDWSVVVVAQSYSWSWENPT